jgi:hypothetical protein
MSANLEWPDLVSKTNLPVPALEIGVDYLPEKYQIGWIKHILSFTSEYVSIKNIKRKATIWNWGGYSQNLRPGHEPGYNMFHISFGLPAAFMPELEVYMKQKLGSENVGIKEHVAYDPDAGWMAICHIEQGKAWEAVDANEWSPILAKPLRPKM